MTTSRRIVAIILPCSGALAVHQLWIPTISCPNVIRMDPDKLEAALL